jgi:hypothetical protein
MAGALILQSIKAFARVKERRKGLSAPFTRQARPDFNYSTHW